MKLKLFYAFMMLAFVSASTFVHAQKLNALSSKKKKQVGNFCLTERIFPAGDNVMALKCQKTGRLKMVP